MEILKKTGKVLLGVAIGAAITLVISKYYGKQSVVGNQSKEPVEYVNP